jgi:4-hydroxybenzoate polyprenyltransferase/phosphoserine phosphatase
VTVKKTVKAKPLVVDLDGTLLHTDTLLELMLAFIRMRWVNIFILTGLLFKDRATMKAELSSRTVLDMSLLPARVSVVELINEARANGRPIVLATASDQAIAERVADAFGPFDEVFASTPGDNLKGHRKAQALVERFGEGGFDYVGNDHPDLVVFQAADTSYLVTSSSGLLRKALTGPGNIQHIPTPTTRLSAVFRALRPHQWVKNLLIFVPALAAQALFFTNSLSLLIAFALFSAMASAVYITNDLFDLSHDRSHPTKKHRPFASGNLPIALGLALIPLLGVGSIIGAWLLLSFEFAIVLVVYAAITFAYSTWLKRIVLVDVFVLTGLYGIRIIAGAVAFSIPVSPWLATFSTFAFLSLALLKRFAEIASIQHSDTLGLPGRGYRQADIHPVSLFGVVSGFVSAVVLALYLEDPDTARIYSLPLLLWVVVAIWLFWITRTWFIAFRGEMKDDPIMFAITDWPSYVAGALIVLTLFIAR